MAHKEQQSLQCSWLGAIPAFTHLSPGLVSSEPPPPSSPLSSPRAEPGEGLAGGGDTARSGDSAPVAPLVTARRPALQVLDTKFWKPRTPLRSCARAPLCGDRMMLAAALYACRRSFSAVAMSALAFSSAALKPSNLHPETVHYRQESGCSETDSARTCWVDVIA